MYYKRQSRCCNIDIRKNEERKKNMGLEHELEKLVQQKKVEKCELCHNRMQYVGGGKYRCAFCGMEVLDDFGKIKQFLDQNGPTPEVIIAQQTGISIEKIDSYLKKGMVEIPNGSKFYLNCERCGCEIRYGRYCPECAKNEMQNSFRASYQDVGERPKQNYNPDMAGKMHFINRRGN